MISTSDMTINKTVLVVSSALSLLEFVRMSKYIYRELVIVGYFIYSHLTFFLAKILKKVFIGSILIFALHSYLCLDAETL